METRLDLTLFLYNPPYFVCKLCGSFANYYFSSIISKRKEKNVYQNMVNHNPTRNLGYKTHNCKMIYCPERVTVLNMLRWSRWPLSLGRLSNDDGDLNENCKKINRIRLTKCFLYISFASLHDYNLKLPNFKFCGGRQQKTVTFSFFSWSSIQRVRIPLQKKIANVWRIEQDGISAIKFETVRLHFCDVFVAAAAVVA